MAKGKYSGSAFCLCMQYEKCFERQERTLGRSERV